MEWMMRFRAAGLVLMLGLMAGSAEASAIPIVVAGILQGATGVTVGSATYDVTFIDGTCAALFSGCDNAADFPFQSAGSAVAASQALLDQVFLDDSNGLFDTHPELTRGCTQGQICIPLIPYLASPPAIQVIGGANFVLNTNDTNNWNIGSISNSFDTLSNTGQTYAVFQPSASPVPEPATLTLLGLGSVGLGLYRRRRRG